LDAEAISVPLIGRMIERATENDPRIKRTTPPKASAAGRFARDEEHFAVQKTKRARSEGGAA
jgi:hypothetical protein